MNDNLSFFTPTFDVAALSATMDGIDLSRTPFFMLILDRVLMCSFVGDFCSSTWQSGGVVSDNK
jgi:hypothetical protein